MHGKSFNRVIKGEDMQLGESAAATYGYGNAFPGVVGGVPARGSTLARHVGSCKVLVPLPLGRLGRISIGHLESDSNSSSGSDWM
jgi:hypothetical protein